MKLRFAAFSIGLLLLILNACDSTRSYSIEELEQNKFNSLELRVSKNISNAELTKILEELATLDQQQLLEKLAQKDLELNKTSYSFYYLAISYAKENDLDQFFKYQKIAAEQYLNPLSMLKMAVIYKKGLPELKKPINPNFSRCYEYLHQSLECLKEITLDDKSHILIQKTKDQNGYLLEELERAAEANKFDKKAVRTKLRDELPILLGYLKKMYELKGLE